VKGVILAAGLGTRMRPLTYRRPKPLVPILDRPMIEHIVLGARDAGVTELLIVIGYRGEMVREVLGTGERFGLHLEYAVQEKPAGTGDATLMAEDFIGGEPFFLSWGDIIVSRRNYAEVGRIWREESPDLLLTLNWVEDPWEGAAVYVEDNRVVRIIEKPPQGTSTTHYNNAGIFVLPGEILAAAKETPLSARGERELPDAIQLMLSRGAYVRGVPIEGCWSDVARPAEVIRLNGALLGEPEYPEARIAAESVTLGLGVACRTPYILGDRVSVAEGALLGPSAFLLAGARVLEGCRISHTLVLPEAAVEEGCELEWAVVETGCLVPPGTRAIGTPEAPVFLGVETPET
jgi:NDP-sugar pyrophosphorylase family protein